MAMLDGRDRHAVGWHTRSLKVVVGFSGDEQDGVCNLWLQGPFALVVAS